MNYKNNLSLNIWMDKLSRFFEPSTIKRYYRKHKGEENKLMEILIQQYEKRIEEKSFKKLHSIIKVKRNVRAYKNLLPYSSISKQGIVYRIHKIKEDGGSYEIIKHGKNIEVLLKPKDNTATLYIGFKDKEKRKFESFFNHIDEYFSYAESDKEIIALEKFLQEYYMKFLEISALKKRLKKDSVYEEEEAIKNILEQARTLLYITDNELYKSIPNKIKIKTIPELNKETRAKLEQLNLKLNGAYTYSQLLEHLREV